MAEKTKAILIVCMGNICRSPTAEAVFRAKAQQLGISVRIDSAGTIAYHQGEAPDQRACREGERRGYSFHGIHARQVVADDFVDFDWILAADKENLDYLIDHCPKAYQHKLSLLLTKAGMEQEEIPDPYYGGDEGFEHVLDLLEEAAERIFATL